MFVQYHLFWESVITFIMNIDKRLHSVLYFWISLSAVAEAESINCFNYGESIGKCQISEL